ncbi:unnamed protein product [Bathycoccus prasinos]|jgi:hypothetical protein|tara:strand:+ start:194 stop:976 length:783 start_codon:yes stop_codon:yes gene_type:complete
MSASATSLLSLPSDDELMKLLGGKLKEKEREKTRCEEDLSKANEKMRELKRKCEELEGLKIEPFPLWKMVTEIQYKDIFETHILKKLEELDFRVFREVNTESRDACRRSGRKLQETFEFISWSDNPPVTKNEIRKIEGKQAQYHFCSQAALTGNLALVRWLREVKKFDWNERTINAAAKNGHLHIVTYCTEQRCPRSELACALAAKFGHLDILKYLHENGAPWDSWTCYFARKNNSLECLNYAKENGCPDTNETSEAEEE